MECGIWSLESVTGSRHTLVWRCIQKGVKVYWERAQEDFLGDENVLYPFLVIVTQVYMFVKIHQTTLDIRVFY